MPGLVRKAYSSVQVSGSMHSGCGLFPTWRWRVAANEVRFFLTASSFATRSRQNARRGSHRAESPSSCATAFWMMRAITFSGLAKCQSESDRTAVVLHQQDVTLNLESVGELLNDVTEVIEGISKLFRRRSITMTKPGIVRSDHVVTVGQLRNQLGEHARRRGESVEHEDQDSI